VLFLLVLSLHNKQTNTDHREILQENVPGTVRLKPRRTIRDFSKKKKFTQAVIAAAL
jgi:hypothetical protein